MSDSSLDIELLFEPLAASDAVSDPLARSFGYELVLMDHMPTCARKPTIGSVRFYPRQPVPGLKLSIEQFLQCFSRSGGLSEQDALQFGSWLENALFPRRVSADNANPSEVRTLWDRVLQRADREQRPVRLQISFPERDRGVAEELPFELLAGAGGFYFLRDGWCVVRSFGGTDGKHLQIGRDARIGLLWANPASDNGQKLDPSLFTRHEEIVADAGQQFQFHATSPLRKAQWQHVEKPGNATPQGSSLDVLSVVAHGSEGAVWLHADHQEYPSDPGQPVSAAKFAAALKRAGTQVAFLWMCHSARHHEDFDSVAQALLRHVPSDVP